MPPALAPAHARARLAALPVPAHTCTSGLAHAPHPHPPTHAPAQEGECFAAAANLDVHKALVHIFFAQRDTKKVKGVTDAGEARGVLRAVAVRVWCREGRVPAVQVWHGGGETRPGLLRGRGRAAPQAGLAPLACPGPCSALNPSA